MLGCALRLLVCVRCAALTCYASFLCVFFFFFFFFNDPAPTEIYTLSLHDALPIYLRCSARSRGGSACDRCANAGTARVPGARDLLVRFNARVHAHPAQLENPALRHRARQLERGARGFRVEQDARGLE